MLSLYRALLRLRRAEPALSIGSVGLADGSGHVLAYQRQYEDSRLLIALNLSGSERRCELPAGELLLSTLGNRPPEGWLRPDEGLIIRVED